MSQEAAAALRGAPARLSSTAWAGLILTLGGLFALIALLPDFETWDRSQE